MNTTATELSLKKALGLVEKCPEANTRDERLELRERQLEEARVELASVLPVEGIAGRKAIQDRIELLEHTIRFPFFEETYPCLSMEILAWRNEQGFPKLVPFLLSNPVFSITLAYDLFRENRIQLEGSIQNLPQAMNSYGDITGRLVRELEGDLARYRKENDMNASKWRKSISTRFSGVIPQWVREKIFQSASHFSVSTTSQTITGWLSGWLRRDRISTRTTTNIFLIAEADKWTIDKEVHVMQDPLVVGYKAGCLWLICSFDETKLEEYVRREFRV